tara:strand:- start:6099 stop:6347 length:249 start_codon:yes stop_codon:yes gene_type:complete
MIHLQFFARYREQLGCDTEQLPWHTSFRTMGDVRQHLLARGEVWQVLSEPRIMCARNQELCALDTAIVDGDELAFFPPVTGG